MPDSRAFSKQEIQPSSPLVHLENNSILEVTRDSDNYIVYYNFDKFIDCFTIGKQYTFFGTIAAPRNGYAGCLRLDYVM